MWFTPNNRCYKKGTVCYKYITNWKAAIIPVNNYCWGYNECHQGPHSHHKKKCLIYRYNGNVSTFLTATYSMQYVNQAH